MISNYSLNIFLLKLFTSIILFILIYADIRLNKINIKMLIGENNPKKSLLVIGAFICYLSLTLIYSKDPVYGIQKILNFLTITIPLIIAFYYLIITYDEKRLRVFINSIVIISLISVVYILIDYPFQPGNVYEFRPGKWSHVIYGRMMGTFALVLILYSISLKDYKPSLIYAIISSIATYGLFLSTHRSTLISLILVMIVLGVWLVVSGKRREVRGKRGEVQGKRGEVRGKSINPVISLITVIVLTLVLIFILPKPEIVSVRYNNLASVEGLEFGGDGPILSRFETLKLSWQMFVDNPVFGVGFGGFKAYNDVTEFHKYPHNIFAEMAVEGGIIGLLVLCSMLYVLFKNVSRYFSYNLQLRAYCLMLATFALLLTLFSKDLPSQSVLWIWLAVVGMSNVRGPKPAPNLFRGPESND